MRDQSIEMLRRQDSISHHGLLSVFFILPRLCLCCLFHILLRDAVQPLIVLGIGVRRISDVIPVLIKTTFYVFRPHIESIKSRGVLFLGSCAQFLIKVTRHAVSLLIVAALAAALVFHILANMSASLARPILTLDLILVEKAGCLAFSFSHKVLVIITIFGI